jgi:hypothetical protein
MNDVSVKLLDLFNTVALKPLLVRTLQTVGLKKWAILKTLDLVRNESHK